MAYSGTTAGTTSINPPVQVFSPMGGSFSNSASTAGAGGRLWLYNSTNSSTQLTDTAFFTDAYYLGMRTGDVVIFTGSTGSSAFVGIGVLGAVTTAGAALASTGGIISSTR